MSEPEQTGTAPDVPTHNGRTLRQLAGDAEDSLLGIMHLTEADERRLDAEDIFGTFSGVTRMLEHVPDVITRLRTAVLHQHQHDALRIRSGHFTHDPDAAVQALTDAVDAVLTGFGAVRTNMERAQASLSGAEFDDPGSGTEPIV